MKTLPDRFFFSAVLLRDTALRCIDHLIAQPTKSGLSTAVSDLTAQIELSLRIAKEMVSVGSARTGRLNG
jgi:hypothetical protein